MSVIQDPHPAAEADYFNRLYAASDDPWSLKTRWYEQRKRALLAACLPAARYGRAFEPGCAAGEFTTILAERCEQVLAVDRHERAVSQARNALSAHVHVAVRQAVLPEDWPDEKFDLIVVSELGYYFEPPRFATFAACIAGALTQNGVLLACHWRHDFEGRRQSAEAVHATLADCADLTCQVSHREPDFLLHCWSRRPDSIARREGLA